MEFGHFIDEKFRGCCMITVNDEIVGIYGSDASGKPRPVKTLGSGIPYG